MQQCIGLNNDMKKINFMDVIDKKSDILIQDGDYEENGIIYCGGCHTPKQCKINVKGISRIVPCMCKCGYEQYERERNDILKKERMLKAEELRVGGIPDKRFLQCRFENAYETTTIKRCRRYAMACDKVIANNIGMLLWGTPGGGKTFAAVCIANEFIDRCIPAMITSFPKILEASFNERNEFINKISKFPLLIIDDLGVERTNEFSLETVYEVIDERYKSGKPLIITTNLDLNYIRNQKKVEYIRIYSRILKMCTPIKVFKENFREKIAKEKVEVIKDIFG